MGFIVGIIHLVRMQNFPKFFFGKFCVRTEWIISYWFEFMTTDFIASHCVKSVQIRSFFWSVFSCIQYLRSKSPYSVRIQENTNQKKLHIWTFFSSIGNTTSLEYLPDHVDCFFLFSVQVSALLRNFIVQKKLTTNKHIAKY